jgi:DNA invertase Pin-like site-specific DNA recombinase
MSKLLKIKALGYLRTSSSSAVGAEKDSEPRQRAAIEQFAAANGFEVVEWYYDAAVSGADALDKRAGFAALLDHIEGNGVRTVICEDASRLARTLAVQEAGIAKLQSMDVTVLTSRGDNLTQTDDEMRVMMRQVAGAFSQLEKTRLVKKLKHARDAKRAKEGKCEGSSPVADRYPLAVTRAKELAAVRKQKPSLRSIAAQLASEGFLSVTKTKTIVTPHGTKKRVDSHKQVPFTAKTIAAMLA